MAILDLLSGDRILHVAPPNIGLPTQFYATTAGDGTGVYNHAVNYSGAITDVYYQATTTYDIYSILICITDNATFNYNDYGAITTGTVTNGVQIVYYNSAAAAERLLLSGRAFTANYQWGEITEDVTLTTFAGSSQSLKVVFNMQNDYGQPFHLNTGDKFIFRLHDNFSTLVSQTFGLRGIKY